MASIYGVELKNKKTFRGAEGYGLAASVYIDGKKVGTMLDDGWGGSYRYEFDTAELEKRADKHLKEVWLKDPANEKYNIDGRPLFESGARYKDVFIDQIFNLGEVEKRWKAAQKTNWTNLIHYHVGDESMKEMGCTSSVSTEDVIKLIAQKRGCKPEEIIFDARYISLDDFKIV